jgi:hypothetical protein
MHLNTLLAVFGGTLPTQLSAFSDGLVSPFSAAGGALVFPKLPTEVCSESNLKDLQGSIAHCASQVGAPECSRESGRTFDFSNSSTLIIEYGSAASSGCIDEAVEEWLSDFLDRALSTEKSKRQSSFLPFNVGISVASYLRSRRLRSDPLRVGTTHTTFPTHLQVTGQNIGTVNTFRQTLPPWRSRALRDTLSEFTYQHALSAAFSQRDISESIQLGRFQYRLTIQVFNRSNPAQAAFTSPVFATVYQQYALRLMESADLNELRAGSELQITFARPTDLNTPTLFIALSVIDNFVPLGHDPGEL